MRRIVLNSFIVALIVLSATTVSCDQIRDLLNVCTVTFNLNYSGSPDANTATVKEGEKVSEPTKPTRAGYEFVGWYKEAAGTTVWNFTTDVVNSDMTLYAKWDNKPENLLVGIWEGSYEASQGEVGLTLTVYKEEANFKAVFDFYNLPGKTNSKEGKYLMNVTYDESKKVYLLKGYEWIERPDNYIFVDLEGKINENVFSGISVQTTGGGGSFRVVKK